MLGQLMTTWLIPVAIGVTTAVAVAAVTVLGRRIRAWVRRNRTIEPGIWWV